MGWYNEIVFFFFKKIKGKCKMKILICVLLDFWIVWIFFEFFERLMLRFFDVVWGDFLNDFIKENNIIL